MRGRPPRVYDNLPDHICVAVKGITYAFRPGNDGQLRPVRKTGKYFGTDEYAYAKQLVKRFLASDN